MSNVISVLAFTTTIFFSLSQSYIVYIVKRNEKSGLKTTSLFSIISCLIYQLIWFIYYRIEEKNNICWCYLVGTIFSYIWTLIYLYYYSKEIIKKRYLYLFLYIFSISDLIIEIWFIEKDIMKNKKNIIKIISCFFNVLMYITPGLRIFSFFKELDSGYISFPISIIGLLNSFIWLLYAIISNDENNKKYYLYTNIFGISFCIMQIICNFIFKSRKFESSIIENKLLSDTDSKSHKRKKKIKKKIKKALQKEENEDLLNII